MSKDKKPMERFMDSVQNIDRLYEEYAKAKGLTYISLTVLDAIYEAPEICTQKYICEVTHYPKQSVNIVIKSFYENGYVELKETPEDRRNKMVILTDKGQKYADEIIGELCRIDKEAIAQFSEHQRDELVRLMELYEQKYSDGIKALMK